MTGEDFDEPLRLDCCDQCGAVDWRSCCCVPAAPRREPTPAELERARTRRQMRAELEPELYAGCDCSEPDGHGR